MAEHKECKHYDNCCYRNDIGTCPNWCVQFKHKDDVRVVRCKDCKNRTLDFFGGHYCKLHKGLAMVTDERKDNG